MSKHTRTYFFLCQTVCLTDNICLITFFSVGKPLDFEKESHIVTHNQHLMILIHLESNLHQTGYWSLLKQLLGYRYSRSCAWDTCAALLSDAYINKIKHYIHLGNVCKCSVCADF
jgi:hypothetical protein